MTIELEEELKKRKQELEKAKAFSLYLEEHCKNRYIYTQRPFKTWLGRIKYERYIEYSPVWVPVTNETKSMLLENIEYLSKNNIYVLGVNVFVDNITTFISDKIREPYCDPW